MTPPVWPEGEPEIPNLEEMRDALYGSTGIAAEDLVSADPLDDELLEDAC